MPFKNKTQRTKAFLALALVCFFWGTTWVATKQGVLHMPPLQMAGIRQLFAGVCFVLFFIAKGAAFPKGKEWMPVIALSFLNFMLSNTLSAWGVKYISAGLGAIISAVFPLWMVLLLVGIEKTKISAKTGTGILLGFAGICVIFYEHLSDFFIPDFRLGIVLSLVSTWTWAVGTIYTKKQAALFNPYFSLGLQMVLSGAVLLFAAAASGNAIPVAAIPWQSWTAILYLILFGSIISYVAYLYALQHLPAEQASIYAYINPIVAALLGWIIFDEKLTPFIFAGTVITLYGVYLVNKKATKLK